jgi:hypothetical protein
MFSFGDVLLGDQHPRGHDLSFDSPDVYSETESLSRKH